MDELEFRKLLSIIDVEDTFEKCRESFERKHLEIPPFDIDFSAMNFEEDIAHDNPLCDCSQVTSEKLKDWFGGPDSQTNFNPASTPQITNIILRENDNAISPCYSLLMDEIPATPLPVSSRTIFKRKLIDMVPPESPVLPAKFQVEEDDDDVKFVGVFKSVKDLHTANLQKKGRGEPKKDNIFPELNSRPRISSSLTAPFVNPLQEKEPEKKEEVVVHDPVFEEKCKNIHPDLVKIIQNEIMSKSTSVHWDDIAGLEYPKSIIQEAVVLPQLRPELFTGLRRPVKGILLFGPPGTGKTLIGKCIASQSGSTFFSISASSLTSKYVGESEKLVRALFTVASARNPSVVFIDEIDSLLTQRSEGEHESSRRIKTEFLVQLDGATTSQEERVLIVGATNRPQELDEAARRRLVKRLYIPLPELNDRIQLLKKLLKSDRHNLTESDLQQIGACTDGYSGADVSALCQEASMGPIRSVPSSSLRNIPVSKIRPLQFSDFELALQRVKATVSQKDLDQYRDWDRQFGSGSA